jgi:hypothetical protein
MGDQSWLSVEAGDRVPLRVFMVRRWGQAAERMVSAGGRGGSGCYLACRGRRGGRRLELWHVEVVAVVVV